MSDCHGLGDCEDDRMKRIYEYVDGALSRDDLAEIKAHLDTCEECSQEHDLECLIRSVVKRSCQEHAPQTLKERIIDRIGHIRSAETVQADA
ncbi:anti-sigma factor [Arthrobacter crystallopoietes BAB-32]|uniref:Anti-sigma factor n=1 Tax=Arthrobacter crystallopoietes BAB-32 TaxID=1246476 RepID=N1V1Q3_9MICC|nr:mycothiol system anti-sigma-R factor [Arthrobacter crystallopoietes]EMY34007.1 anti-sigma factor [Arthrobacter crystallopoietes BAB-32]